MLPSFLIIGAAKCGTTSAYNGLARHPDVFISEKKEPAVFMRSISLREHLPRYEKLFDGSAGYAARGEASVAYTLPHKIDHVSAQIARIVPDARLIYMVRDPIRRLESDWRMRSLEKWESSPISEAVDRFSTLVTIGLYWRHLCSYRRVFDESQLMVVFLEDFVSDPEREMRRMFEHIQVDPSVALAEPAKPRNTAEQRRRAKAVGSLKKRLPMLGRLKPIIPDFAVEAATRILASRVSYPEVNWDPRVRQEVADFLRPDARELLTYCGKPADFWDL